MARPAFKPTAEQRQLVQNMSGIGCTEDEIQPCVPWGLPEGALIDCKTLRKHFAAELARGHALDGMRVRRRLHDLIDAGNVAATIFYCKVRLGMKETSVVEATGKDGVPLPAMPTAVVYLPLKDDPPDNGSERLVQRVRADEAADAALVVAPLPLPPRFESPSRAAASRAIGRLGASAAAYPRAADPR